MDTALTTISSIQTYFDSMLRGVLDDNIFFDAPQQTINDAWKSFVVVDLGTEISDMNAYSGGTVRVMLYIRPISSGMSNVALAQEKEKIFSSILKENTGGHYLLRRLANMSDFDDDTGFHVITYILRLTIL